VARHVEGGTVIVDADGVHALVPVRPLATSDRRRGGCRTRAPAAARKSHSGGGRINPVDAVGDSGRGPAALLMVAPPRTSPRRAGCASGSPCFSNPTRNSERVARGRVCCRGRRCESARIPPGGRRRRVGDVVQRRDGLGGPARGCSRGRSARRSRRRETVIGEDAGLAGDIREWWRRFLPRPALVRALTGFLPSSWSICTANKATRANRLRPRLPSSRPAHSLAGAGALELEGAPPTDIGYGPDRTK